VRFIDHTRFPLLLLLLAACAGQASPARPVEPAATGPATGPEVAAIEAVLAEFRRAIVARDGEAMLRTMIGPEVPFRSRQVDNGKLYSSTAAEFAKDIATAKEALEERFTNVVITEREAIAVLDANYEFVVNGRVTNHGREVWTLIRTPDGWKITMVTWSVIPDPPQASR
jgi:ketosteroid isomerase-like protein